MNLPLSLQLLVALYLFLKTKTHLLGQARLGILPSIHTLGFQRGQKATFSLRPGKPLPESPKLWNNYCFGSVVSGPALDSFNEQQIINLFYLISQLTASNPNIYLSLSYFIVYNRNLSSHPIPYLTRFTLQVVYQGHSLLYRWCFFNWVWAYPGSMVRNGSSTSNSKICSCQ